MGFEIYTARSTGGLEAGKVAIAKNGLGRFSATDLKTVGVERLAVVLLDAKEKRLAVRAPVETEGLAEPSMDVRWTKGGGTARINLGGAFKRLGIDPEGVAGLRSVTHEKDMLVMAFGTNGTAKPAGKKKPGRPRKTKSS
jgi:hypothetical protein